MSTGSKTDDGNGRSHGRHERDDGDKTHVTTWVTDDRAGWSIRASYDEDKKTGRTSDAHFHDNSRK